MQLYNTCYIMLIHDTTINILIAYLMIMKQLKSITNNNNTMVEEHSKVISSYSSNNNS